MLATTVVRNKSNLSDNQNTHVSTMDEKYQLDFNRQTLMRFHGNNSYLINPIKKSVSDMQLKHPRINSNLLLSNSYRSLDRLETNNNNLNNKMNYRSITEIKEKTNNDINRQKNKSHNILSISADDNDNDNDDESYSSENSTIRNILSGTSSSSSMKTIEEEADNLNDLLYRIRKHIDEIENNYSVESLFNCLRNNLSHNGYGNYTIKLLEKFKRNISKSSSSMSLNGSYYDKNKRNSINLKSLRNSTSPDSVQSVLDPISKLFKNLNLLRRIYQIIQRDLIFNVLIISLPAENIQQKKDKNRQTSIHSTSNVTLTSRTLSDLTFKQDEYEVQNSTTIFSNKLPHLDLNYETGRFTIKSRISISNSKNLKRLNKYHHILYELNEKVLLLLNDKINSDLKLLSNHTKLPQKYEFYKCGEFIMRLVPDIIYKIKIILKLCQKCYELSDKFNGSNDLLHLKYSNDKDNKGIKSKNINLNVDQINVNLKNFKNNFSDSNYMSSNKGVSMNNDMLSHNANYNAIELFNKQSENQNHNQKFIPSTNEIFKENNKSSDYEYYNNNMDEIKFKLNKRNQSLIMSNKMKKSGNKLPIIKEIKSTNLIATNISTNPAVILQAQNDTLEKRQLSQSFKLSTNKPINMNKKSISFYNYTNEDTHNINYYNTNNNNNYVTLRKQDSNNTVDSFIRETDSSALSDESNENNYENYKMKTPRDENYIMRQGNKYLINVLEDQIPITKTTKVLPPIGTIIKNNSEKIQTNNLNIGKSNGIKVVNNEGNISGNKDRDEIYEEYLRKKDEITECELLMDELRDDLKNLINRTERCATIKDKINSIINVIRETEMHMNRNATDDQADKEVLPILQKELNLLKYRLKLLTQDLDVEEAIKQELRDAIHETDHKLNKAQTYYEELNQQLNKLDKEIKILYKEYF